MKKRIICFILTALMLISAMPISVIAEEINNIIEDNSKPIVKVESVYVFDNGTEAEFRALPDNDGTFYLDISLSRVPDTDEIIDVYYRTIDDSAVAKWGDYEGVGMYEDVYVTLSRANNYKARVIIKSTLMDHAAINSGNAASVAEIDNDRIASRRFIFDIFRVEGNADIRENDKEYRNRIYCYLKANNYFYTTDKGYSYNGLAVKRADCYGFSPIVVMNEKNPISTEWLYGDKSTSGTINYQFDDGFKNLLSTGNYKLGISILGKCKENYWNSDGPVTFDLYYTYQGKTRKALSLVVEGEFDDSNFFGWEPAFDYAYDFDTGGNSGNREKYGFSLNRDDFMDDCFYGITVYDNDGKIAYQANKDESRDEGKLGKKLKQLVLDGKCVTPSRAIAPRAGQYSGCINTVDLHYLQMPTNFAYADSYSWNFTTVTSAGEQDEARRLEDVYIVCRLMENQTLTYAKDENGEKMITTNIDQLREGDQIRMSVRFNQFVVFDNSKPWGSADARIKAKVNGKYDITLGIDMLSYNTWDTFVFAGAIPKELEGVAITSLRDIKLEVTFPNDKRFKFQGFVSEVEAVALDIPDIYVRSGGRDLRTPVATIDTKSSELWTNSRSLDIYVNTSENVNSRFNDSVTVYYEWNNIKDEPPKSYSSKISFYTSKDGEISKNITGTGNGEMYLHIKSVSAYGKVSYSDAKTVTYNPDDSSAEYTPFGPFKFDNAPPTISADDIDIKGNLKDRVISIKLPEDGESGLRDIELYYIPKNSENGEGKLLKKFTADDFKGEPKTLSYTISHKTVGVGVDADGNVILERGEIEFYWVLSDNLGNSSGKIANFLLVFDTNDYIDGEISAVGPYDVSNGEGDAQFKKTTSAIDDLTFIYNYKSNIGKNYRPYSGTDEKVYYAFAFTISDKAFGESDVGEYGANITYKGEKIDPNDYTVIKESDGDCVILFYSEMVSGRYDIQLTRKEGDSVRVSRTYSVYATYDEDDETAIRTKIKSGTLLSNSVYQLSSEYPYFYYKDENGVTQRVYYNDTKQVATFSTFEKAKNYVYFNELRDIYLVELTTATANALISGTTGYLIASGESVTPQAGQYWIRYKSKAWTPTSGDSAWVYYYYGNDGDLAENRLSGNLQAALNTVSNRIAKYGKSIILTDESLFLGYAQSSKLLDKYGMPYLLDGQIHSIDEFCDKTICGNIWSSRTSYAADKNIYKSDIYVGIEGTEDYKDYPIVGNFMLPEDSIFQFMGYDQYKKYQNGAAAAWTDVKFKNERSFINAFTSSGVYYIREMSPDGVSIYAIYIDKEAPLVSFSYTDEDGSRKEIPVDGIVIKDIKEKNLHIGSIAATEYDRLSYVAIYKINNLSLVGVYTAADLELSPVKLLDGNYYIVVADRSGNHYTVNAKISSTPLECDITEYEDKFIKLSCNRRADQIVTYEVYLNGELLTGEYAAENTFDKAGLYSIYIQDIYGNEFVKELEFSRNYPSVNWKYLGSDGRYYAYDNSTPTTSGFVMTWVEDNQYKISTSVKTRFSFSEAYEFEFIGAAPEYNTIFSTETVVTIEAGQSFTLKVYYKNHKDCYTIYSCVVDVTPPSINVSAEIDTLKNGERDLFDEWLAEGSVGDVIMPDDIYYALVEIERRTVASGGFISSDIIRVNASDANELSLIEVYLDGELIKKQDVKSGFSEIIVSRWGNYRVVAKDSLGNASEFTFTNGMPDGMSYFVDGAQKELTLHGYLNFEEINGKHIYNKVDFGNTDFKIDVKQNANVFMAISLSEDSTQVYGFRIIDGVIYSLSYTIINNNGEKEIQLTAGEALIDVNSADFRNGKEYLVSQNGEYEVYASLSADNVVSIKVYAPKDSTKVASISARVEVFGSNIMFVSSEISKKSSTVSFKELGVPSTPDLKINKGFTVDESAFAGERVSSISLYYSKLNDLDLNNLGGKANIYAVDREYSDEGFYLLIVRNLYGNDRIYRIAISSTFGITSSVTFGDDTKIYYSKTYDSTLYSNGEITLDVLDEGVTLYVTLNGAVYTGFAQKIENGIAYFIFSQPGSYEVKLTDSYGNQIKRKLEINKSTYSVAEDLLTGYNEKAIKRKEGYTNQKLSVDKAVFDREGIYYLAIQYGEKLNVLFDAFAETPITTDAQNLIDVIGADGDGVYKVICRNRYGAVVTKEINYRATPTLKLERTIRSKTESEIYDLNYAASLGFWSNNTLKFSTDASTYVFTINGSVTECPRTLVFENAGDYGNFEYDITYVDEYGFEYKFKAYLIRKDITVNIPSSITGIEVDGILNTRNDISITFGENIYATYTRNNGEEVIYHSGDVLKKDGTYRFTVIDYAGNVTTTTIKKDTAVEFAFVESVSGSVIQSGSVVNSTRVTLDVLNKDSAYIEKVLRNGVLQSDFTGNRFSENGKWELILSDKLGNKAYFCFYIITRNQNGFAYTTPYEYRITELWYDNGDGVKVSYLGFVNHTEFTSSFDFKENGNYSVVMTSDVSGMTSMFDFSIDTTAPEVSLVGCGLAETTINDVTIAGYEVGDLITVYRLTDMGEEVVEKVEVLSLSTKIPTITEGGKYRVVVESEAGVSTELTFVRKHVMNTAGSVFIMVIIALAVVGLFTGLIYRNKSKTDD